MGEFGSCSRKIRYPDFLTAERVRDRRQKKVADWIHIYECVICRGWHLTKSDHC